MGENQVFPDWLDIDTGMLAEEISDIEVDLLHNSEKYRSLHKEKFKLLNAYPNLYKMWDRGTPSALTARSFCITINFSR